MVVRFLSNLRDKRRLIAGKKLLKFIYEKVTCHIYNVQYKIVSRSYKCNV